LWIVSDKSGHFDSGHARAMTELASFVGIALRMLRNEQSLRRALDEQEMLAKEMSHRVNNQFQVIEGLIRFTAKGTATKEEMVTELSGRLHALAAAHALVRRNFIEAEPASRASDLGALIRTIVRPHEGPVDGAASRFSIKGPSIQCGDHAANGIALIVHELATNAAKYGALKANDGRVEVSWRQDEMNAVLRWVERGGPRIEAPPTNNGFGSVLAQSTVVRQFGGTLDCEWQHEGLTVTVTLPLARLST